MGIRNIKQEITNNTTTTTTTTVVKTEPQVTTMNNTLSTAANSVSVKTEPKTITNAIGATAVNTVSLKTEPQVATNNFTRTLGTVAFTTARFTQSQTPINNNYIITSSIGANTKTKNKRARKTETSSDTTGNANTNYASIAANANPPPKRKKKNKKPANGHTNDVVMQAMPDIGHPFFVLERIRATKLTDGNSARNNNINGNSMPRSFHINNSQPNLPALPQVLPQAHSMYPPSRLGPPPPLRCLQSNLTARGNQWRNDVAPRGPNGMPLAPTLIPAPTLVHVESSVTVPAPVPVQAPTSSANPVPVAQAQLPSVNPPTTTASASLVVDLTEDEDVQAAKPSTPPTSDRIGDLVEQFQRNLEEKQEEMNMWCSKMTQLMMGAPKLIKAAGQVHGGEAETRALSAAETLSEYGSAVLSSCVDACDNVRKRFKYVDGAHTTATTTAAASATFSNTATAAADRSR